MLAGLGQCHQSVHHGTSHLRHQFHIRQVYHKNLINGENCETHRKPEVVRIFIMYFKPLTSFSWSGVTGRKRASWDWVPKRTDWNEVRPASPAPDQVTCIIRWIWSLFLLIADEHFRRTIQKTCNLNLLWVLFDQIYFRNQNWFHISISMELKKLNYTIYSTVGVRGPRTA